MRGEYAMTRCRRLKTSSPQQRGTTLLEVLITIFVLSLGLLGIAGLTAASLQNAKLSQFQTIALQLANDYADRMRGNVQGVTANNYEITSAYDGTTASEAAPECGDPSHCTAAELADLDRAEWVNSLRQRLPGGGAYVTRSGLAVDIWVIWQEPGLQYDDTSNLSVAGTGGSQCPPDALGGYSGDVPVCIYYRFSI
jgi:type IV pilus assembly protein PilV